MAKSGLGFGTIFGLPFAGQGYMTEAALLATEACFGDTSVERIEIRHDEANARSAVIPQRCGYTETLRQPREAQAPGETGSEVIWTMTRADFEARQK